MKNNCVGCINREPRTEQCYTCMNFSNYTAEIIQQENLFVLMTPDKKNIMIKSGSCRILIPLTKLKKQRVLTYRSRKNAERFMRCGLYLNHTGVSDYSWKYGDNCVTHRRILIAVNVDIKLSIKE